ncbi:hypothetical protein [Macrococcus equipercicus]|uniref:Uncharacterized protein n=1 Tax=Macrococcus equipercicus TaxID=69967 RepID=A0A9Q9F130_9STAP|nr:hypothetical protein [Macrococcus equipercicus]KAA1039297.1 hypothetical protein ERX35_006915 [Macrococcus equipercicus]UTH13588.1 hypothetical protein KFV11_10240 [Macrococcus equipercicus]
MKELTPDEIAHLTQGEFLHDKATCPHQQLAVVLPDRTLYICLDCGMERTTLTEFTPRTGIV